MSFPPPPLHATSRFPPIHLAFFFNITAFVEFSHRQIHPTPSYARVALDNETFLACEEIAENVSLFLFQLRLILDCRGLS